MALTSAANNFCEKTWLIYAGVLLKAVLCGLYTFHIFDLLFLKLLE